MHYSRSDWLTSLAWLGIPAAFAVFARIAFALGSLNPITVKDDGFLIYSTYAFAAIGIVLLWQTDSPRSKKSKMSALYLLAMSVCLPVVGLLVLYVASHAH